MLKNTIASAKELAQSLFQAGAENEVEFDIPNKEHRFRAKTILWGLSDSMSRNSSLVIKDSNGCVVCSHGLGTRPTAQTIEKALARIFLECLGFKYDDVLISL